MNTNHKYYHLSQSQEDYLKIIHDLIREKRVARIRDIAQRKNVSMPSVTAAMHKLAEDGYISYTAREYIELTTDGQKASQQLINRHQFLSSFLQNILQIAPEKADAEACLLEHQLQPETIERMIILYQFLINCPLLGQNIPELFQRCLSVTTAPNLPSKCPECFLKSSFPHTIREQQAVHNLLADLEEGQTATVVMLGPDNELRRALIAKGMIPGIKFSLLRRGGADRPYQVQIGGTVCLLSQEEANFIEVATDSAEERSTL